MNQSLATTGQVGELNGMVAAVYDYIAKQVSPRLVNFGPDTPAAENRGLPWIKTDTSGNFVNVYTWNGTEWSAGPKPLISNPTPASGKERRLWVGAESEVWLYDGGDGTDPRVVTPTETAGAMWQVDHAMDLLIPVGAGSLPGRTPIGVGATAGEEKHQLTPDESGQFTISGTSGSFDSGTGGAMHSISFNGTTISSMGRNAGSGFTPASITVKPSGQVPHNNMPPVIGVFFIGRTARKFY